MKVPTDIASLAKAILSPECKHIGILSGAGISVASGIPDFRSKGGMYDTLKPELLTATNGQRSLMKLDPTYVVEKEMFFENQFPYLEVRRPFILGTAREQWKATLSHRFAELLHVKTGKLTRIYTQNIDGLHEQCDQIPSEKIVAVHGSIKKVKCENCGNTEIEFNEFCKKVETSIKDIYNIDSTAPKESKNIICPRCKRATLKPSTVLFGSNLPSEFFERAQEDLPSLDMLIIAGTSLVVSPANSLVYSVPEKTVRVVINKEPVGSELGIDYSLGEKRVSHNKKRDLFIKGNCDDIFMDLMLSLGWIDELKEMIGELPPQSKALVEGKFSK